MANPAHVYDVEARWRPLTAQETINTQAYLDDAWVILRRRIYTLEAAVLTDRDLADDVVRIETQMVLRVLRNPDGKSEEAIDDYRYKRDNSIAAGALYVSDAELEELAPIKSAAFSIRQVAVPFTGESAVPYSDLVIDGVTYGGIVYRP